MFGLHTVGGCLFGDVVVFDGFALVWVGGADFVDEIGVDGGCAVGLAEASAMTSSCSSDRSPLVILSISAGLVTAASARLAALAIERFEVLPSFIARLAARSDPVSVVSLAVASTSRPAKRPWNFWTIAIAVRASRSRISAAIRSNAASARRSRSTSRSNSAAIQNIIVEHVFDNNRYLTFIGFLQTQPAPTCHRQAGSPMRDRLQADERPARTP